MFANVHISIHITVALSLLTLQTSVINCAPSSYRFPVQKNYHHQQQQPQQQQQQQQPPKIIWTIGCLVRNTICRPNEYCYDDQFFGACLPYSYDESQYIPTPPSFSDPTGSFATIFNLLRPELDRVLQYGASLNFEYLECMYSYALTLEAGAKPQNRPCYRYLHFSKPKDNENEKKNNIDVSDDPLRKYKNGPRIYRKQSTIDNEQYKDVTVPEGNIELTNDELSALPILLIRGKNLPAQIKPEIRILRSANYYEQDNDDDGDDGRNNNNNNNNDSQEEDDVETGKNTDDILSPYVLVDDPEDTESVDESPKNDNNNNNNNNSPTIVILDENKKSDNDYEDNKLMKEFDTILNNIPDERHREPLYLIETSDNSERKPTVPLYGLMTNVQDIDKIIEPKIDDIYLHEVREQTDNGRDESNDNLNIYLESKTNQNVLDDNNDENDDTGDRDSDVSQQQQQQQQQETIYGTINYNNANDEHARRLSNFYRKHRYDIKKPGPKYLENYFFEDFFTKPNNDEMKKEQKDNQETAAEAAASSSSENGADIVQDSVDNFDSKNWNTNDAGTFQNRDDDTAAALLPALIMNEANMRSTSDTVDNQPLGDDVFETKLVTENPESEQTIRSSLPLSEGPVKVDAKLRNTLIIRKADQNEPTDLEAIDSTHTYVITDRQITTDGSKMFIKTLEQVFRLPRGTFSNLRLEKQQITFKVNPNYRDFNASQVAAKIEENAKLLRDITGFWVQESGIGNRAKLPVISEVITKRENQRLIHYTLLICSSILASLAAAFVILVFRRNMKFREKVKGIMKGADELLKSDYTDIIRQRMKRDTPTKKDNNTAENGDSETATKTKKTKSMKIRTDNRSSSEGEKQIVSPSSRSSTSSWSEEPVTSNMDIATGHLVLTYMEGHLKKKDRLDKEWEALCAYEVEPCSTNAASLAQNAGKNRSPDVLPYDHSRVILNDLVNATKSDYINANSITDSDPRNPAYIATQGPLTGTRSDFWQMVWEQGSVCIVMLTRLRENGLSLCDRYWPEEGAEIYQDYEVHLVSEHIWCDDFLVRSFYLKNLKTSETRTVTQFHFLSWPENGLPPSTKALLDFRRKINKSYKGRSCPVIVHCSDGIGRTGTYILIDMVLNRLSKGAKEIDIAASLEHLRDQRIGLVKSKQQFEFVLLAVADEVQAILKSLAQN